MKKKKYYGEFYKTNSHFLIKQKEIENIKFNTQDCLYILAIVSIIFVSLFSIWR